MTYVIRVSALALFMLLLSFGSAAAQEDTPTYVLVHGAFQDSSAWDLVVSEMEAAGATVVTASLAGRDGDETPLQEQTLETHVAAVSAVVEAQDGPVILVGHSLGGMIISQVAENMPERVETLIYVTAFLPLSGEYQGAISENDRFSQLNPNLVIDEESFTIGVNPEVFAEIFCPDCNEEQAEMVSSSQLDESLAAIPGTVELSDENFGSIRKVYIMAAQDFVLSAQLQAFMLSRVPVERVYALNTGHAPYITAPESLATLLIEAQS
ncbi:MAG: alpha/beta fold hydrolase [Chloroflexota bacterium]